MEEDNISQLGDYDVPFCEQQYMHGSFYISLFKFISFDQFNTPQTASKFRHFLSCGTTVPSESSSQADFDPVLEWKTATYTMPCEHEVAMLALYSKSKDCAKHVRVQVRPPLSVAVMGDEKIHLNFLQALVSICSQI